jgi:YVTN family beta-propeller protein
LARGSDGKTYLISGNAGTEDVSIMDFGAALTGSRIVEVAPRVPVQSGTFVTPDGRFAVVTGGANTLPDPTPTGTVFVIDLRTNSQVATITGVGIDPYNLTVVEGKGD